MAKITVAGQAVVVTSDIKLEDLRTIKKYRPKALHLFEGEGEEREDVFAIGVTDGVGAFNTYGIEFASASRDEAKKAQMTFLIPDEVTDVKAYVSDKFGASLLKLNRLESELGAALSEIAREKAAIEENITIIQ